MIDDSTITRIVCEFHEDYIVDRNGDIEFVSCKHRELTQGPWSLVSICLDGGLAHLFSRWTNFPQSRARLITNGGLKRGPAEAMEVIDACEYLGMTQELNEQIVLCRDALVDALLGAGRRKTFDGIPLTTKPASRRKNATRPEPPEGFTERVELFMSVVRVRSDVPARTHIREYHIESVVRPTLLAVGRRADGAAACYKSLLDLIRGRNASNALTGDYRDWLTDPGRKIRRGSLAALIAARTIYHEDVVSAIVVSGATTPLRRHRATGDDRLRIKLKTGGVHFNRINSAVRLRESWLYAWAKYRTNLPGDEGEREDIEARIMDIVGDVEAQVCSSENQWGSKLYEGVRDKLRSDPCALTTSLLLEPEHLLGVALDLTAQCQLWFSAPFDVDAALSAEQERDAGHAGGVSGGSP